MWVFLGVGRSSRISHRFCVGAKMHEFSSKSLEGCPNNPPPPRLAMSPPHHTPSSCDGREQKGQAHLGKQCASTWGFTTTTKGARMAGHFVCFIFIDTRVHAFVFPLQKDVMQCSYCPQQGASVVAWGHLPSTAQHLLREKHPHVIKGSACNQCVRSARPNGCDLLLSGARSASGTQLQGALQCGLWVSRFGGRGAGTEDIVFKKCHKKRDSTQTALPSKNSTHDRPPGQVGTRRRLFGRNHARRYVLPNRWDSCMHTQTAEHTVLHRRRGTLPPIEIPIKDRGDANVITGQILMLHKQFTPMLPRPRFKTCSNQYPSRLQEGTGW